MGKNKLIYGGVSKSNATGVIFEWISESTACETCKSLNGTRYNSIEDIPDRPHPNCKCYVKDVHIGSEDYEVLQREIDKLHGDLSSLRDQILTSMNEEESDIQNSAIQDLLDEVYVFEYDLDEVSSDIEQVSEEDSTGNFEKFNVKINEIKNNLQVLKQKIIEKINGLKKEVCDCMVLIKELENVLIEAYDLNNKIDYEISDINQIASQYNDSKSDVITGIINDVLSLAAPLITLSQSLSIFITNYERMKEVNVINADKYYHAKANCEAAQLGLTGSMVAQSISELRELTDSFRNIYEKKHELEVSLQDILGDLKANIQGRELGRKYPTKEPKDILKDRIPNGLDKKYW